MQDSALNLAKGLSKSQADEAKRVHGLEVTFSGEWTSSSSSSSSLSCFIYAPHLTLIHSQRKPLPCNLPPWTYVSLVKLVGCVRSPKISKKLKKKVLMSVV